MLEKFQDFFTASSGKRKRDELPSQYQAGGFLPQQDGAGDTAPEVFEIEVCSLHVFPPFTFGVFSRSVIFHPSFTFPLFETLLP